MHWCWGVPKQAYPLFSFRGQQIRYPGNFVLPVTPIRASRLLLVWLSVCTLVTGGVAAVLFPVTVSAGLCLCVAGVSFVTLKQFGHFGGSSKTLHAVRLVGDSLHYRCASESWVEDANIASAFVTAWLTVVKFKPGVDNKFPLFLLVLPDSMPKEDFRRLRLYLLWQVRPEVNFP